jgi:hypothetical protein
LFAAAPLLTLDQPMPKGAILPPRPSLTVNDVYAHVSELLAESADFPLADDMALRIASLIT